MHTYLLRVAVKGAFEVGRTCGSDFLGEYRTYATSSTPKAHLNPPQARSGFVLGAVMAFITRSSLYITLAQAKTKPRWNGAWSARGLLPAVTAVCAALALAGMSVRYTRLRPCSSR
ncbi:hypothetical protein K466DRAFT_112287 [Polyporus arcularius HHB13444]|uniref:Uncharacterized protein n=1 Tax=Polyporus arcularius HHB13444 TaxID=1314778 RepID=A0A5C3NLE6_9APHY|nr:hypothetical protein K466DRAFT_112287 [Polyporus arcularius HHB13444]